MTRRKRPSIRIFHSLEEENAAERRRLAKMTPKQRLQEFAVLEARRWGASWTSTAIVKTATWERVDW